MKRMIKAGIVLAGLILPATLPAQIPPHAMAGGGGLAQKGSIRAHVSVGQPMGGILDIAFWATSDSALVAGVGFWYQTIGKTPYSASDTPLPDLPSGNRLFQNVPNPFNPSTTISFSLAQAEHVRLRLFNIKGEKEADLIDQDLAAGSHSLVFRPTELSSGVYFYQLEAGSFQQTRRLLLLK